MLDGGQNTNDMDGSMQVYTPSFADDPTGGVVKSQIGGSPSGVMPTPIDVVKNSGEYRQPDRRLQQLLGRASPGCHQARHQCLDGSAYEYYLDNNFSANTWDNNFSGTPLQLSLQSLRRIRWRPHNKKDILGGKTYFFANFEGFRWNNSATYEAGGPSAKHAQRHSTLPVCNAAPASLTHRLAPRFRPVFDMTQVPTAAPC